MIVGKTLGMFLPAADLASSGIDLTASIAVTLGTTATLALVHTMRHTSDSATDRELMIIPP